VARWSGGLGDGDGEPECFELADVAAGFAAGGDTAGVVAGAEVGEAGGAVRYAAAAFALLKRRGA
jgi:hypothetical protein